MRSVYQVSKLILHDWAIGFYRLWSEALLYWIDMELNMKGCGAFSSNYQDMMTFALQKITAFENHLKSNQTVHLGWIEPNFIDRWRGDTGVVWHNGMVRGYSSYMAIAPHLDIAVVVLSASANDVTKLGISLPRQARVQC